MLEHESYPDGGPRAYIITAGCFFGAVTCLGLVNSIGAIQSYVSGHQLNHLSSSTISWIFSVYLSLTYSIGIVSGPIFDHKGAKPLLMTATVLIFAGLFGAANASSMYQFVLCFIALGLGNGIGLSPVVGVINHWFFVKRGTITGIVTSGGSFGGLVFPLLLRYTLEKYDYQWTLRILAFVNLGCMTTATVLLKERFKRETEDDDDEEDLQKDIFNWKKHWLKVTTIAKRHNDSRLWLVIAGSFCAELSLVLLLTYFVSYAIAQGNSESTGYLLLTVWNGVGILGRMVPGLLSDYLGKFNVCIAVLLGMNLTIFIIWLPFGHNLSALYVFAGLGGFVLGLILGMIPACLSQITVVSQFGERYGILNFFISFGNLVGVPIGAAIIETSYDNYVLFVGIWAFMGMILFYGARYNMVGFRLNVKV